MKNISTSTQDQYKSYWHVLCPVCFKSNLLNPRWILPWENICNWTSHVLSAQKLPPAFVTIQESQSRVFQRLSGLALPVSHTSWDFIVRTKAKRWVCWTESRAKSMLLSRLWKFYFTCSVRAERGAVSQPHGLFASRSISATLAMALMTCQNTRKRAGHALWL